MSNKLEKANGTFRVDEERIIITVELREYKVILEFPISFNEKNKLIFFKNEIKKDIAEIKDKKDYPFFSALIKAGNDLVPVAIEEFNKINKDEGIQIKFNEKDFLNNNILH